LKCKVLQSEGSGNGSANLGTSGTSGLWTYFSSINRQDITHARPGGCNDHLGLCLGWTRSEDDLVYRNDLLSVGVMIMVEVVGAAVCRESMLIHTLKQERTWVAFLVLVSVTVVVP
jgi:hypothetical protein